MPKAAAGRGEKTTAASAVIPKITPIVRMTLAPYEALIVGHLKVRTTINVPFLPLVPTVADEMRKHNRRAVYLAVMASRMSAFGGKADIDYSTSCTPLRQDRFRKSQKFCELSCARRTLTNFGP